jgi:hypothetical protein
VANAYDGGASVVVKIHAISSNFQLLSIAVAANDVLCGGGLELCILYLSQATVTKVRVCVRQVLDDDPIRLAQETAVDKSKGY